ncbi:hypothetical protein SEUCBS140593_009911 [Sporothrix eucalyptigena]|uniref:Zn(2)-C6 fungal-type domain-containing protein n=1 Tax=Sporothrix eucalyptigena TaxID=1812306 RepID=A0ABP0CZE4_9PEZI
MPPTPARRLWPPPRTARKGHYSCDFCRARKLRCSRPLPCTNCVSRGKKCVLGDVDGYEYAEEEASYREAHQAASERRPPATDNLLEEVHRLRRLAEDLEKRFTRENGGKPVPDSTPLAPPVPTSTTPASPDALGPICAVVTHLDRVSMGKGSYSDMQSGSSTGSPSALSSATTITAPPQNSGLHIKIEPLFAIPTAPEYTFSIVDGDRLRSPKRCIYLPTYREMTVLLGVFLSTVSSFYHIVHHPTVPDTVRRVYDCVQNRRDPPLGDVLLLLSIIATGTCLYDAPLDTPPLLFASRDEASRQTPYWIQAALHVLDVVVRGPAPPSLSAVQGVITLSFLISNVEGVGYRYRYIVSTGLMLGRELGLHCIDQEPFCEASTSTAFERELGRRAWWYLASTDWLLAARNSGPGVGVYQTHPHMMRVNEPCHMDDAQLSPDTVDPIGGMPRDVPTDMSYFLQRVRLAKVARGIVDRMPMVSGTQFVGRQAEASTAEAQSLLNTYRQAAIASDADLDAMLHDLPPFLRLETYAGNDSTWVDWAHDSRDSVAHRNVFIHAFMLHSLIHTQRCKLHLSYLTSWRRQTGNTSSRMRPSVSSSTTSSRAICIESARQIIYSETQLRRRASQHPYFQSRLSCVLYGVFLATIVLLIDLCAADNHDDDDSGRSASQKKDAFAALQIVADARHHSPAAAELYTSLMQLLRKHRPQLLEEDLQGATRGQDASTIVVVEPSTDAAIAPAPSFDASGQQGYDNSSAASPFNDNMYANPLALNFDGMGDLVNFQWEDLLAGVDTSMFL